MNKYVSSEKGVGSLMAVLSLAVLMVIVGGIATMTIANSYENKNNKDNMQIQYAAEAGLKKALVSFNNYKNDSNAFDWLPNDDTLNDNGVVDDDVKTNLHKYKEENAKASYAVYICRKVSENPDEFVKVNNELKNAGPVNGTRYYITAYGFINSGNDKKKVASAVISYGESGGGLDTETKDNKPGDPSKGKIALYSDTKIEFTNYFYLKDFIKEGKDFYTAIASNGPIGDVKWTIGDGQWIHEHLHPSYKILDKKIDIGMHPSFNWQGSDDLNIIIDKKDCNKIEEKFNQVQLFDKYDTINENDSNIPLNNDSGILKGLEISNKINFWNKIIHIKNLFIKVNNINGPGINITNSKLEVNNLNCGSGDINFTDSVIKVSEINGKNTTMKSCYLDVNNLNGGNGDLIFMDSVVKASEINGKNITLKNCYIIADSIKASEKMNITDSIIEVKSFESATGGKSIITNSKIVAANSIKVGKNEIKNSIIESNGTINTKSGESIIENSKMIAADSIDLGKSEIKKCIIESNGTIDTGGGKLTINSGILSATGSLVIGNGLDFNDVFVQANGMNISTETKINLSIFNSLGNINLGNGTVNLEDSLILAENDIKFAGTNPQKIIRSFAKSFNGEIHFGNTVELLGIILAQGMIKIHQGADSFQYNDESFSKHLDLSGVVSPGSNILNNFESFLGLQGGQGEGNLITEYGTKDYLE